MLEKRIVVWCGIAAILGISIGYVAGQSAGFEKGDTVGYERAKADIKKGEEFAGVKATEDAAQAANPFQAANPLEGVSANPFDKAKKILNPFE